MYNLKKLFIYSGFFYTKKRIPKYHFKGNFYSTHSNTLKIIKKHSKVLDIGCYDATLAKKIKKKNCLVDGIDNIKIKNTQLNNFFKHNLDNGLPKKINYNQYDYIIMLDVIEHLNNPEFFLKNLKKLIKKNFKVKILISTPNIAFFIIRLSLLFGNFNYTDKGILDFTHKRLFTFSSFSRLITDNSFTIKEKIGIPAPFPVVLGDNLLSKFLIILNRILIKLNKKLFSFQMLFILESK